MHQKSWDLCLDEGLLEAWPNSNRNEMQRCKSLIIGGNRGIGLALVKHAKEMGHEVHATFRNPTKELQDLGCATYELSVDVPASVEAFLEQVKDQQFEFVIHNSGILKWGSEKKKIGELDESDLDAISQTVAVNGIAPLRMLNGLIKSRSLADGSKFGCTSSHLGSITDSNGQWYGTRSSKCLLNMAMKSAAVEVKSQGIAVGILHPGMVKTDLLLSGGINAGIPPEKAAAGMWQRLEKDLTLDTTGTFWNAITGKVLPW
jgi:NAD(P)-dependent dehydrogenase (short-subunit alcohol dehydrogenase family)